MRNGNVNLPQNSQLRETAVIAGGETQREADKTIVFQYSIPKQPLLMLNFPLLVCINQIIINLRLYKCI